MIHFISDTHFSHKNIIKYSSRPYEDTYAMNKAMTEAWNAVVAPDDTVYHLGDFAFAKIETIEKILENLNGNIHFVHGNHDKEILKNKERLLDYGLFKSITPYQEIHYKNQFIVMCHYGMRVWNKSHHGSWMLYGHSHGSLPPFGKSVDVGVDAKFVTNDYRPISFDEIKSFMDNRQMENNHHADIEG